MGTGTLTHFLNFHLRFHFSLISSSDRPARQDLRKLVRHMPNPTARQPGTAGALKARRAYAEPDTLASPAQQEPGKLLRYMP